MQSISVVENIVLLLKSEISDKMNMLKYATTVQAGRTMNRNSIIVTNVI